MNQVDGPRERPTRQSDAGRAYLDLRRLARAQRRPTDELHELYALEGFLARLAVSRHARQLILKGGVLLAAYDARRPTRDVDMQVRDKSNEVAELLEVVREIVREPLADGLVFDSASASAEVIRDDDEYSGVRVSLTAGLSAARMTMHVDLSVGDPIWPGPRIIQLPRLLGGVITLSGYPLHMVYAEKIATCLQRGSANTRWRDYADLYLLIGRHQMDGGDLHHALVAVTDYRGVDRQILAEVLEGYGALAQMRWAGWRRRHGLEDRLPERFDDVLQAVISFADPALRSGVVDRRWDHLTRSWANDVRGDRATDT